MSSPVINNCSFISNSADVPEGLRSAAVHQVRVQLIKLSRDGAITFDDDRTERARVRLTESG